MIEIRSDDKNWIEQIQHVLRGHGFECTTEVKTKWLWWGKIYTLKMVFFPKVVYLENLLKLAEQNELYDFAVTIKYLLDKRKGIDV